MRFPAKFIYKFQGAPQVAIIGTVNLRICNLNSNNIFRQYAKSR